MKKIVLFWALVFIMLSMTSCDSLGNSDGGSEHTHTYSDWMITKEASCFEEGIQTRICDNCDKTQTLPISAEHSWCEWTITKEATCTEAGLKERICDSCQEKESEDIAMLALHPWGAWEIIEEVTCTEDGEKKTTCTSCGKVKIETIAATAHSWSSWSAVTEATCTKEGERERVCVACEIKESETVDIRSHSWSSWKTIVNSTCTEEGAKERICSSCELKESENISMRSHSWSVWTITKEATCTEDGSKERTCSSCDKKEFETIVSEHSFLDGVCSKCNATVMNNLTIPEAPLTLDYGSWSSITITSLRIEIYKEYKTEYLRIYYTAEKTYDKGGASSTEICRFTYKLYDSQGYVVKNGNIGYSNLVVGDKVSAYISLGELSNLDPNETYTLVLTDYT